MSKGALFLATEHPTIDYIGLAKISAALVEKYLNIDTHIHISQTTDHNTRMFRWHDGIESSVRWYNSDRTDAFDISPFDQTLLLDVDYLTFNDNLKKYFDIDCDFLCYDRVYDVTNTNSFVNDQTLSRGGFPMLWATVVYFRKTDFSHQVFETMKNIKKNYKYYSRLFGFRSTPYRNDFALSIAHHLTNGYQPGSYFEHPLLSINTDQEICRVVDNNLYVKYNYNSTDGVVKLSASNVHCMNKKCLQDPNIIGEIQRHAQS